MGQPGATPDARLRASFLGGFNLDAMVQSLVDAKPLLVDRARLWALIRMTQHDSNAITGIAKMRYMTWRPFNAIRNADRDDNPATERDAGWTPVLSTPNHPEYPCGHCVASATIAALLAAETDGPITVRSDATPGLAAMHFKDWPSFLEAASLARIQAGVHFRLANEAGQAAGRRIAELRASALHRAKRRAGTSQTHYARPEAADRAHGLQPNRTRANAWIVTGRPERVDNREAGGNPALFPQL